MNMINIFSTDVKIGREVLPISEAINDQINIKGLPLDKAYMISNDVVKNVLDNIKPLLFNNFKHTLVFIKPMFTKIGKPTCLEGWHYDCYENPTRYNDDTEIHHIWCGYSNDTTEFIFPKDFYILEQERLTGIRGRLDYCDSKIIKIPKNTICTYNRYNAHRGPLCTEESYRLLIRVTETNRQFGGYTIGSIAK